MITPSYNNINNENYVFENCIVYIKYTQYNSTLKSLNIPQIIYLN